MEIMPDHVHLLVEVHPQFGIHRFVKHTKGISSSSKRVSEFGIEDTQPVDQQLLLFNGWWCSVVSHQAVRYVENQKNV